MAARRRRRWLRLRRPMWKRPASPPGLSEPSLSCRPVLHWALRPAKCPGGERALFAGRPAVRSASAWLAHPPGGASIYPASFTLPLRFGSPPVISRDTELRASDLTLQRLPLHRQAGGFALRAESLEGRRLRYPLARGGGGASKGHGVTPCGSAPENPSCSPQGKGLWLSEWAESPYPTAPRTTRFGYEPRQQAGSSGPRGSWRGVKIGF